MLKCFQLYFNPVYIYIKKVFLLAIDNEYALSISAIAIGISLESVERFLNINFFGVPNLVLILVLGTILIDAWWGIKKSLKKEKELIKEAFEYPEDSLKRKRLLRRSEFKKFDPKKLQFTFFKALTLLGYLFFAKQLLSSNDPNTTIGYILGFGTAALIKTPIAIFWYYDFKSIGDNSAYVYGKKAPIFSIVEKIFEPKIGKFFKNQKE